MRSTVLSIPFVLLLSQGAFADTYSVDVWADNWFSFYVNGEKVAQDSVSITTERSFNAESFSFAADRPFVIGLIAKDFKENDTGLEYIGTRKQQMGDGGVIVQVQDEQGSAVALSDASWRCLVVHQAPANKSCAKEDSPVAGEGACGFSTMEEPDGWSELGFDDSGWTNASVYSESDVRPKDGYDQINWDGDAKLIWGADLETDNTILCRKLVD